MTKQGRSLLFNDPNWFRFFMVRIAPGNTSAGSNSNSKIPGKKLLPGSPLEYNFLDDAFNEFV